MNLFKRKRKRRLKVLFNLSLKAKSKKGLRETIITRLLYSQASSQEKEMGCLSLAILESLMISLIKEGSHIAEETIS